MTALARALWAEALKTKRTLALWLAVAAPLSVVGLQTLITYQRRSFYLGREGNAWIWFGEDLYPYWTWLALPLFIGLQTALVAGLEHRNGQWRRLYALPLSRWTVYGAKQFAGMATIGLSTLCLVGFTLLAGVALRWVEPGFGFGWEVPWNRLLRFCAGVYLASWLSISIHTWVSQRYKSFVVSMSVAAVASVFAMFAAEADWGAIYPWVMPRLAAETYATGEVRWLVLALSVVGGTVFAAWGCRDVTRRDVLDGG